MTAVAAADDVAEPRANVFCASVNELAFSSIAPRNTDVLHTSRYTAGCVRRLIVAVHTSAAAAARAVADTDDTEFVVDVDVAFVVLVAFVVVVVVVVTLDTVTFPSSACTAAAAEPNHCVAGAETCVVVGAANCTHAPLALVHQPAI